MAEKPHEGGLDGGGVGQGADLAQEFTEGLGPVPEGAAGFAGGLDAERGNLAGVQRAGLGGEFAARDAGPGHIEKHAEAILQGGGAPSGGDVREVFDPVGIRRQGDGGAMGEREERQAAKALVRSPGRRAESSGGVRSAAVARARTRPAKFSASISSVAKTGATRSRAWRRASSVRRGLS